MLEQMARGNGKTQRSTRTVRAGQPAVASGRKIFQQGYEQTPPAGFEVTRDWVYRVALAPPVARLVERFRRAYPELAEALPQLEGDVGGWGGKARWIYHNAAESFAWEHEAASHWQLSPEHECLLSERDDPKTGVNHAWYRFPDGRQELEVDGELVAVVQPDGVRQERDGWRRWRDRLSGDPKPLDPESGATDVHPDGSREWHARWSKHQVGLHREDGPARILADGTQEWYRRGRLHRSDGPARILTDGTQEFWRNGKQVQPGR